MPGGMSRSRWLIVAIAAVAITVYGVAGYLLLGLGFVDALFHTVGALTTAGFTDRQLTQGQKYFTVSIAVIGAAMFLAILAMLTSAVTEGRLGIWSRRRRMERRIESFRDHFVICAYGRVGKQVTRELEAQGVPHIVIDRKSDLEQEMMSDGVVYIIGDPTSDVVLRRAGIDRARGLISAVDSDADNVYITLTARSLNARLFIVARASEPSTPDRLYRAGADRVISPYVTSGRHMALLALRPRVVDYFDVGAPGRPTLRLEEVLMSENSPLIGRSVREAAGDAIVLLVQRADGALVSSPPPDLELRLGDFLVLAGEPRDLQRAGGG